MNCIICSIAQKHVAAKIVYEDSVCIAYIPSDAATVGNLHITPKQHFQTLEEIPDDLAAHFFYVASYAASAVYEGLGSHGTNIICNNGAGASSNQHIIIDVIPRKENDGLSFLWEPKKLAPSNFNGALKKIKDKTDYIGIKKEKRAVQQSVPASSISQQLPSVPIGQEKQQPEVVSKDEENYMIKHLYRIP